MSDHGNHHEAIYMVAESGAGRGVLSRRWKCGVTAPDADPWAYSGSGHQVESYLFDLSHNPRELANLAGRTRVSSRHPSTLATSRGS